MKLLIVYGTKAGATAHCAEKIRQQLPEDLRENADLTDIRQFSRRKIADYDGFIVGTPIYMGRLNGRIQRFFRRYRERLLEKPLHLFICSLAPGAEGVELFRRKADPDLVEHASQVSQLGCEIHPEQLNAFYRFIIQKILETEKPEVGLRDDDIAAFARGIAAGSSPS